ncbi:MAG: B12-binding domain-containing radical SAM protein [archaeon]|nr:B12-binding domain-containing radical SAM protein [archaeon]
MKILMLSPPFLYRFSRTSRSPAISKGGCVYYPIWMGYATGVLEQAGHEVKLIDAPANGMSSEQVQEIVKEWKPELMVFDTVTASFKNDVRVLEALKKVNPKSFAIMVGTHVGALPEESIRESVMIDAVARGEYDYILRDLAQALEEKKPLDNVLGITYRDGKEIKFTPNMPPLEQEQLDAMPFASEVYKKHLRIEDYFYPSVLFPEVTIITGRGCKFRCTFCKFPQTLTGHSYRARSPKNVVDEFEWISKNLPQVKDIMIEDDTMTQDKQRMIEICKEVLDRKLKVTWTCNARADVDLETLQWMKKAGCRLLCVGFESSDQQILNNIKKGTKIERIEQFMVDTKKANILVHGCFMLGNRGETKDTIRATVAWAKKLDPDTAQFFPLMLYPGTEAYRWASENNFLSTHNWEEWLTPEGTHNTILNTDKLTAKELVEGCDWARKEFYMRPSYILGRLKVIATQPRETRRLLMGGRTFLKYLLDIDFWKKSAASKQVKDEKNLAQGAQSKGKTEEAEPAADVAPKPIFKITQ